MAELTTAELSSCFQAPQALLPHIPWLLQDLHSLGCFPDLVVDMLSKAGLREGASCLDIACGKGAACLALARELKIRCRGVDIFPSFLEEARARANTQGLAGRCVFELADVRRLTTSSVHDAVLLLSTGQLFGNPEQSLAVIRRHARPGGLLLLDMSLPTGRQAYSLRPDSGDKVVEERIVSPARIREQNELYMDLLSQRGQELAERQPELGPEVDSHLKAQQRACKKIEERNSRVMLLVRRGNGA